MFTRLRQYTVRAEIMVTGRSRATYKLSNKAAIVVASLAEAGSLDILAGGRRDDRILRNFLPWR